MTGAVIAQLLKWLGYRMDDRGCGSSLEREKHFSSPACTGGLCGPTGLSFKGYQGFFPWGKAAGALS